MLGRFRYSARQWRKWGHNDPQLLAIVAGIEYLLSQRPINRGQINELMQLGGLARDWVSQFAGDGAAAWLAQLRKEGDDRLAVLLAQQAPIDPVEAERQWQAANEARWAREGEPSAVDKPVSQEGPEASTEPEAPTREPPVHAVPAPTEPTGSEKQARAGNTSFDDTAAVERAKAVYRRMAKPSKTRATQIALQQLTEEEHALDGTTFEAWVDRVRRKF